MPIVSRELNRLRPQANGTFKVQEKLTDHAGRVYYHAYTAESDERAYSALSSRSMEVQLKRAEAVELLAHVREDLSDPSAYENIEMSDDEVQDFVISRFRRTEFKDDPDFCIGCAAWISTLPISTLKASTGQSTKVALDTMKRASDISLDMGEGYRKDKEVTRSIRGAK